MPLDLGGRWTHVCSTHGGRVVCFDEVSRLWRAGVLGAAGALSTLRAGELPQELDAGPTSLAPIGHASVVFARGGRLRLLDLSDAHSRPARVGAEVPRGSALGAVANGLVLAYQPATGAAVAFGATSSELIRLREYPEGAFRGGWTHMGQLGALWPIKAPRPK